MPLLHMGIRAFLLRATTFVLGSGHVAVLLGRSVQKRASARSARSALAPFMITASPSADARKCRPELQDVQKGRPKLHIAEVDQCR